MAIGGYLDARRGIWHVCGQRARLLRGWKSGGGDGALVTLDASEAKGGQDSGSWHAAPRQHVRHVLRAHSMSYGPLTLRSGGVAGGAQLSGGVNLGHRRNIASRIRVLPYIRRIADMRIFSWTPYANARIFLTVSRWWLAPEDPEMDASTLSHLAAWCERSAPVEASKRFSVFCQMADFMAFAADRAYWLDAGWMCVYDAACQN